MTTITTRAAQLRADIRHHEYEAAQLRRDARAALLPEAQRRERESLAAWHAAQARADRDELHRLMVEAVAR